MATLFGRFEVQSELSKSDTALIYKAMDTENNQVVALKTQSLEPLGDRAEAFVETLIAEGDLTRDLVSQNIVLLYGAGEIDGQFCASMEYIQGNSVATMLARKEGFSIWDLLDITRQVCAGLEHAATKGVVHHSLEPAKIMVQWDGLVKILGYGISNMSLIEAEAGRGLGRLMPYCSPEQIRGEAIDLRSNVFTLGAILYEMVVGRKAFDAEDPVALLSQIENEMPQAPSSLNAKIHVAVSALVMKALAKDPAERYQNARELVDDLEKCKESGGKKSGTDAKKPVQAPKVTVDAAARAAAVSKFVSTGASAAKSEPRAQSAPPRPVSPKPPAPASPRVEAPATRPSNPRAVENRATAAAAGAASGASGPRVSKTYSDMEPDSDSLSSNDSTIDSSFESRSDSRMSGKADQAVAEFDVSASESQAAESPVSSVAMVEAEPEEPAARVAVDPMMSEPAAASAGTSFSDLAEMPPLKEPVFTPPAPEPSVQAPNPVVQIYPRKDEKPKIQPREVAEKAMKEISTVPPRLMLFSILGAVAVILVVAIAIFFHVRSEDDDSTVAPQPAKTATPNRSQPVAQAPAAASAPTPEPTPAPVAAPIEEPQPNLTVHQTPHQSEKRNAKNRRALAPAPVPVVIPGQALIDSTPQGAQFQVDGKSDPSWVTPFTVPSLTPGKHVITVSKSGYTPDTRSVDVAAGTKSSLVIHLAAMNALVVVNSTPLGAEIIIDGKPTGRVTPAQFAVEKGSHTVLVRKQGFLEETVTTELGPAQNFQYSPALRALGNAEDIRTVGKLNKLFGRGNDSTAGMGTISIHTQPKGAQVAINQRVLEKLSPVDVMLGPGNYIVDITLTGFKPVHKVVSVDKSGKAAIDEILERQ
jgi:eukaryotic-like serine/threonine-protein kinase